MLVDQLCLTLCDPMECSCQVPLSMEFSRQEHWSGLPFPSPGDLPNPGMEPRSPALQVVSLPSEPPGKPCCYMVTCKPFIAMLNIGRHLPFREGEEAWDWGGAHVSYTLFQSTRKSVGILGRTVRFVHTGS